MGYSEPWLLCGGGVGKRDLIQLSGIVLDHSPVEVDGECPVFQIYLGHDADVAVEDILVIVVADLHDPVTELVGIAATADTCGIVVQGFLQE